MNIFECSQKLRELTKAHANYNIALEDYRRGRKELLDALDLNVNGVAPYQAEQEIITSKPLTNLEPAQQTEDVDKTQPYFAKKINKCMSFIKGDNRQ